MPRRVKYRKEHRGVLRGEATRGNKVDFGDFGLQCLDLGWIPGRTLEAGRVAATRTAPEAKVWVRVFPQKPVTAKPAETRMGKGKGEPEYYAAVVRPGTVLFEISGVPETTALLALNRVAHKLPVRVRFVRRRTH
ncbi:MAG TPA: 50S ribosomal protein L16 [Planctomycetota bacterium]|jgi:large subunit ribosomal protein L16|nr:50S ribosomal protein L16 [Planctomycetota bacterium]